MNSTLTDMFKLTIGGTVKTSDGYIQRSTDDILYEKCLSGEYSYVLACRQIGKSSLRTAVAERLLVQGVCVVQIELYELHDIKAERWYFNLIDEICIELNLAVNVDQWWNAQPQLLAPAKRFVRFIEDVLLAEINNSIVIFIDEIDLTLGLPFTDDFFATIRYLHNERRKKSVYERLTFVLIGVAAPDELINGENRTPFNIGRPVSIHDFSFEECKPFQSVIEAKYPEMGEAYYQEIHHWANGHPYLTQKLTDALLNTAIMDESYAVEKLVMRLFIKEETKSEPNLDFVQTKVLGDKNCKQMLRIYRDILCGKTVTDDKKSPAINRLKLYGLVVPENGFLRIRNKIYEEVFSLAWCQENQPPERYRKVAIFAIIFAMIITLFAGVILWNSYSRVPNLAASIESDFFQNADPQHQFDQLLGLIELDSSIPFLSSNTTYHEKASELFFRLPAEQQLAIFAKPQEKSPVLIQQIYTALGDVHLLDNEEDFNRTETLLSAMVVNISSTSTISESVDLKDEITSWVQARELVRNGNYIDGISYYDRALKKNRNNPATLFERALVKIGLEQYQGALDDLEEVARVVNLQVPAAVLMPSISAAISDTLIVHPTLTLPPTLTSTPVMEAATVLPNATNSDDLVPTSTSVEEQGIEIATITPTGNETLSASVTASASFSLITPAPTLTPRVLIFRKVLPIDFVVELRLLFAKYPQLLTETKTDSVTFPNLAMLDLIQDVLKFKFAHNVYADRAQIFQTISYQDDPRLDNRNGIAPLLVDFDVDRSFNYKIDAQLNNNLMVGRAMHSEIAKLYDLPVASLEAITETSKCAIDAVVPAGKTIDIVMQWTEKWAEGVISETVNTNDRPRGNFSVFVGYEPCKVIVQEYDSPEPLDYALKHLRDKTGDTITEELSYHKTTGLDNSTGAAPLQVQIAFRRNYRYQIIERLNTNEVLTQSIQDRIGELYKLPANNPEEEIQTALCPISIVIPAGSKVIVTVEWTERWAEGVINKGSDGSGDRLGTYEVFLGYTEPCSLVGQENIANSVKESPTPTPIATSTPDAFNSTSGNCIMIATCVVVNDELPFLQLQEVTLAAQVNLAASPSHPANFLPITAIPAGAKVDFIAADASLAWMLIAHENQFGWIPTFFSQIGTGRLEPALIYKPLDGSCTQYMGATFEPNEALVSNTDGEMIVIGSIYRPNIGEQFQDSTLGIEITGQGTAVKASYVHPQLTPQSAFVFFAFAISDITKDSKLAFDFVNPSNEQIFFQATFFENNCSKDAFTFDGNLSDRLPIGIINDISDPAG